MGTKSKTKAEELDDQVTDDDQLDDDSEEDDDTETTPATKGKSKSSDKSGENGFKPITTQAQFDAMLFDRMERLERKVRATVEQELKDKASLEAAKEQGNYKELYEKAQKKVEDLEGKIAARDTEDNRRKAAAEAKLPESMIDRLRGDSYDELLDDAKKLASEIAPRQAPETDGGATTNSGRRSRRNSKEDVDYTKPETWGLPS